MFLCKGKTSVRPPSRVHSVRFLPSLFSLAQLLEFTPSVQLNAVNHPHHWWILIIGGINKQYDDVLSYIAMQCIEHTYDCFVCYKR